MQLGSNDDKTWFEVGAGSQPGDKIAADLCRVVFQVKTEPWFDNRKQKELLIKCPITGTVQDSAKTLYADDIYLQNKCGGGNVGHKQWKYYGAGMNVW